MVVFHIITFIDAHSRFTWPYLIKNKSEALHKFKEFKTLVERQFSGVIKPVQTDWG
jgi:histone deacetylase 1/2